MDAKAVRTVYISRIFLLGGLPQKIWKSLGALRRFPPSSHTEAERHTHKMHILGKFGRKNLT
jgi:hypothetical protein